MSLIVCNLTGAAVTLAAGKRTVVAPAKVGALTYGPPVNVTSELSGLSGANYTALEAQRAGVLAYFWTEGVPLFDVGTLTVGVDVRGVTVQNTTAVNQTTTATMVAARIAGHVRYEAPLAADNIYIVAAALPADGAQIIAHQPDFPRKLNIHIVTGSTTALMDIVGIGPSGEAVTQSDIDVKAAGDIITAKAYAHVTSITLKSVTGPAGTIGVGQDAALGLPASQIPAAGTFAVHKEDLAAADEAVGTVDATAGTIIPTTAPNGARIFDFWYSYLVTFVQNTHNHTQNAHLHTLA